MKTTERECLDLSLFDESPLSSEGGVMTYAAHDNGKAPTCETYSLSCPADIKMKDGRVCITYSETISDDAGDKTDEDTEISFDPAEPGLVTVFRSGAAEITLVLEAGKRHMCTYHTIFLDLDVCVHTYKVENTLTPEGGHIMFDYALELRGAATHRTTMDITLKPAN